MWDVVGKCQAPIFPSRAGLQTMKTGANSRASPSLFVEVERQSGRSSGVEHDLAKVGVEGSNPFARSSDSMHRHRRWVTTDSNLKYEFALE
jgi:hypothetical protein